MARAALWPASAPDTADILPPYVLDRARDVPFYPEMGIFTVTAVTMQL